MSLKFAEAECECGLDLTEAVPVRVIRKTVPTSESEDPVPFGDCPECHRNYALVETGSAPAATAPEPAPAAAEPVRAPEPAPEPATAAGPGEAEPGAAEPGEADPGAEAED